jgi:hypothetical protein
MVNSWSEFIGENSNYLAGDLSKCFAPAQIDKS